MAWEGARMGNYLRVTVALLPMHETRVQSPGWEDPLEEGMEIHSSILT